MVPLLQLWLLVLVSAGCSANPGGALDPNNELPFGSVEAPTAGAHVSTTLSVSGWALDDSAVRAVRIYADGVLNTSTTITIDRADISLAYPRYKHGTDRHGWTATIALPQPGPTTLLVQAIDDRGATRDIGTVDVTALPGP